MAQLAAHSQTWDALLFGIVVDAVDLLAQQLLAVEVALDDLARTSGVPEPPVMSLPVSAVLVFSFITAWSIPTSTTVRSSCDS